MAEGKVCTGGRGPGPANYLLPPLVGYVDHDITKYRNPAYTLSGHTGACKKDVGPGPQYNIDKLTRFGKDGSPMYSIKSRNGTCARYTGPGPGTYAPENVPPMKDARPPAYSLSGRTYVCSKDISPGPNQYLLPPCLGPKIPDKTAAAAYSMRVKTEGCRYDASPGPGQYNAVDIGVYRERAPHFSIAGSNKSCGAKDKSPGPAAYYPLYNEKRNPPKFSIGMRYSECVQPMIVPLDNCEI